MLLSSLSGSALDTSSSHPGAGAEGNRKAGGLCGLGFPLLCLFPLHAQTVLSSSSFSLSFSFLFFFPLEMAMYKETSEGLLAALGHILSNILRFW